MYRELAPSEELKPLIRCFWMTSNETGAALQFTTLPDGCLELVVFFEDRVLKDVSLFGIQSAPYDIVMPAGEWKMGIRLTPLGKEYYLDQCETLARFGVFANILHSDCLQHFAALVSADIKNMVQVEMIDRRKLLLFEQLEKTAGDIDVGTLSSQSFWSARQINRYLNKILGIPLKSYSSILKCYAAYQKIKAGDLNPDLGFYDQSHFIREIRKYTGTTPKVLLKNEAQRYLQLNDPG
ncbi:AraC family transcriptional regulator [Chitinophaga sp.]|uniref:AraC family transcriptional regulator n=1 Tax=Chitinophaga sp. TaxID=1869181 RepID=UPI0031D7BCE0